jgi:O-antigen/teichoic acid export membrane protein
MLAGTAIGQGIIVASTPIISRLYTPDDFGYFAIYTSIVSILSILATLRYELPIVITKDQAEARELLILTAFVALMFSAVLFVIVPTLGGNIVRGYEIAKQTGWLMWIPAYVLLFGLFRAFSYWFTREKAFKLIAWSKSIRSIVMVSVQVVAGFMGALVGGLIGGQVIGQFSASLFLIIIFITRQSGDNSFQLSIQGMGSLIRRYDNFPKYTAPHDMLSAVSKRISIFLLLYFYGTSIVGYYAIAEKVLMLPTEVVKSSLRQVLFPKIVDQYHSGKNLMSFSLKILTGMFVLFVLPCLGIVFYGRQLFGFVLGSTWAYAGTYAQWLVIWIFFSFINLVPVLFIQVLGLQKYLLIFIGVLLVVQSSVLIAGGFYMSDLNTIRLYSFAGVLFNIVLIVFVLIRLAKLYRSTGSDEDKAL